MLAKTPKKNSAYFCVPTPAQFHFTSDSFAVQACLKQVYFDNPSDRALDIAIVGQEMQISIFLRFPAEVWSLISCKLGGYDISQLRAIGNFALWSRLCSAGFVESLQIRPSFGKLVPYPTFARSLLHLRRLDIQLVSDRDHAFVDLRVPLLPPTLEWLNIRRTRDNEDFFLSPDHTFYPMRLYVPRLHTLLCWMNASPITAGWIQGLPDTLQVLQLSAWNTFARLPDSLTQLTVDTITSATDERGAQENVFCLPPHLTSLQVQLKVWSDTSLLLRALPPLSALSLGFSEYYITKEEIAALPLTLTSFKATIAGLRDSKDPWPWPSIALTTLCTSFIHPSFWKNLPHTLTDLRLRNMHQNLYPNIPHRLQQSHAFSAHLSQLPPNLRTLSLLSSMQILLVGKDISFPKHLESLHLVYTQLDAECVAALPRTLNTLATRYLDEELCALLPQTLEILEVKNFNISCRAVALLPRTLTHLKTPGYTHAMPFFSKDGQICHNLLEENALENSELGYWSGDVVLPPTLQHLSVPGFTILGDRFAMALGQQLRELNLQEAKLISDRSVPYLSRHLTTLELNSCTQLTGDCFKDLPRSVTILGLAAATTIFDAHVKHLPPVCAHANLSNAVHLTNGCVPDLPRHLQTLTMTQNSLITKECVPHLPPVMLRNFPFGKPFANKNFCIINGKPEQET